MGFFTGLTRLIKGEPVFQPGDTPPDVQKRGQQTAPQQQPGHPPAHAGRKEVPEVYIERVTCRERGDDDMDCDVIIQNYSQQTIELDRIELLGKTLRLNTDDIRSGEERTYRVYSGDRPHHNNETECELYYRGRDTGDYFCSEHYIYFRQLADRSYLIDRIQFQDMRDV